ncbi:ABC protein [Mycena sanguinolenta]|uniref:ABC protein n=1 Tax=Mycena sanguinolenta TaxID=230812 RepID=A0A8H6XNJ6_9AGAR|nr:ABC protein [Mycena sanguinolenta]
MMSQCSACGASAIADSDEFEFSIKTGPQTLARISQLLATNEPPQEPELAVLRPVAQKTAARLACLDAEISRLQDQLKQLQDERASLAEYHAQNTTILSPMRRIPSEILGEIFLSSLPSKCALKVQDSPWVLTHVCRLWRAVAVSNSSLWTRIHVNFANGEKYSLDMARTQIERARTLRIGFYGSRDDDSGPQVNVLQLLLERSSIWQELRLGLIAALVPLLTEYSERLPLLRRAWVQWDGPGSQVGIDSLDFLALAPSLTDITVFSEYRFIPTLLPSHHQLTRYDFDAPWTTHYELLRSLPNLQEVRIVRNFDRSVPWPAPGDPIQLVHLRRMCVSDSRILNYLIAPVLESIAIYDRKNLATNSHLERFITRSSCAVRRLCIAGLPDVQSTEEILRQHPFMTQLALWITDPHAENENSERDLLTRFLIRFTVSNSTRILSHLSKLHFGCENANAISYSLYLNMVDSRWSSSDCHLEDTELLLPNAAADLDPEFLSRMETLIQRGMHISFLLGESAHTRAEQWFHIAI